MTVYLLHFSGPIAPGRHTAQHYLGFTDDLERRIEEHRTGAGARLCEVAKERGLTFAVVRTWDGDRQLERKLKNMHAGPKLCPICKDVHQPFDPSCLDFNLADIEPLPF